MSEPRRLTVAVDGFSSCGKSTFAKAVAARLGYVFIDTGAMYRAVTLDAIERGFIRDNQVDALAVERGIGDVRISFRFNPERMASDIYLGDRLVEDRIRSIDVSDMVSQVSCIPAVREKLTAEQQRMGIGGGIVMDGRDIGTAVFPDAEIKIFMTADTRIRARRRYDELSAKGEDITLEQVRRNIEQRDNADLTRELSPLRKADDAIVLDNSFMSVEQEVEWFMDIYRRLTNEN